MYILIKITCYYILNLQNLGEIIKFNLIFNLDNLSFERDIQTWSRKYISQERYVHERKFF